MGRTEGNMETHVTVWRTASQKETTTRLRGFKSGLCDNLEVWNGEGGGRDVQMGGDTGKPIADSC